MCGLLFGVLHPFCWHAKLHPVVSGAANTVYVCTVAICAVVAKMGAGRQHAHVAAGSGILLDGFVASQPPHAKRYG